MTRTIRIALVAIAVLGASQSYAAPVDIEGRWIIDLAPMRAQAKTMKASPKWIAGMERQYEGGLLAIDASTIKFSVVDVPGPPMSVKYKVISRQDNCVSLVSDMAPQTTRFCIEDGAMHVIDPTTRLTPVYRRQ